MRILFVASRFPWPLTHGDRLRADHQLRLLSRSHRIVLLAPQPDGDVEENLSAIRPFCEQIEIVATPLWKRLWNLRQAPFTAVPLQTLFSLTRRCENAPIIYCNRKPSISSMCN